MTKKTDLPTVSPQRKALRKLCDIYWDEFKDCELQHDAISDGMKVYSSGDNFIHFYAIHPESAGFKGLGLLRESMVFEATELTEKSFDKAIKFIRAELGKKILNPRAKKEQKVAALKQELMRKKKELAEAQLSLTSLK